MKRIVIFASGAGTNAEKIIQHFKDNFQGNVVGVFSNNLNAKVLEKAKKWDIPTEVFAKEALLDGTICSILLQMQPDVIVLAGFLLKFPEDIIAAFPNKVVNVHPALLPKYGGKGMYGIHVHKAVLENKETETGITIHYVNEHYDEGGIIFQQSVSIANCTTPEQIAEKVQELEYEYFPKVIQSLLEKE